MTAFRTSNWRRQNIYIEALMRPPQNQIWVTLSPQAPFALPPIGTTINTFKLTEHSELSWRIRFQNLHDTYTPTVGVDPITTEASIGYYTQDVGSQETLKLKTHTLPSQSVALAAYTGAHVTYSPPTGFDSGLLKDRSAESVTTWTRAADAEFFQRFDTYQSVYSPMGVMTCNQDGAVTDFDIFQDNPDPEAPGEWGGIFLSPWILTPIRDFGSGSGFGYGLPKLKWWATIEMS